MATAPDKSKAESEKKAQVKLYGYQRAWIADESRFKIAVKSRQIGWTFGTTLRHVRRRLKLRGVTVWISASDRQSKEAVEYAKTHCAALQEAFDSDEISFPGIDAKAEQITLRHNGARLIAMPANPDTVRGFSGDVVLDEFAFHRDSYKIWRGAMAIASRGFQVEVISTPNGQQGKYWDVAKEAGVPPAGLEAFNAEEAEGAEGKREKDSKLSPLSSASPASSALKRQWRSGVWSVHHIDIHEAVRQGCPINPVEMRAAAGDEDTWMQEYCCIFLADAENYIPMELIVACESADAWTDPPADWRPQGELYLGVDIGRKKDRTVIWLAEMLGDTLWARRVVVLQRVPFREQFELIDSFMSMPGVRRACVDSTGIGAQIGEDLARKHGSRVEPVGFNIANKEAMATGAKRWFEERRLRIPAHAGIRRAINAVKRFTSTTGHFRFDAERTDAGHADEFWALALATAAAMGKPTAGITAFWKQQSAIDGAGEPAYATSQ